VWHAPLIEAHPELVYYLAQALARQDPALPPALVPPALVPPALVPLAEALHPAPAHPGLELRASAGMAKELTVAAPQIGRVFDSTFTRC
jgi:hypothetical protein